MRFHEFKELSAKVFKYIQFTANDENRFAMGLSEKSDMNYLLWEIDTIKNIKKDIDYITYVVYYFALKGEINLLKDNFNLEEIEKYFESYQDVKWYPDKYTVEGNGGETLNVYINGTDLIGTISGENSQKEQPYLYIEPMKNYEACNQFVADCQALWEENERVSIDS